MGSQQPCVSLSQAEEGVARLLLPSCEDELLVFVTDAQAGVVAHVSVTTAGTKACVCVRVSVCVSVLEGLSPGGGMGGSGSSFEALRSLLDALGCCAPEGSSRTEAL